MCAQERRREERDKQEQATARETGREVKERLTGSMSTGVRNAWLHGAHYGLGGEINAQDLAKPQRFGGVGDQGLTV